MPAPGPRVALLFPGVVRDPATWSGTPAGLLRGLETAGASVATPPAALPRRAERLLALGLAGRHLRPGDLKAPEAGVRRAYAAANVAPPLGSVRSAVARRGLARLSPPPDVVVQIGTGFAVDPSAPLVTYEDMTVQQATEYAYQNWSALSRRDVRRRIDLQRACYERATAVCMSNSWAAGSALRDYGVPAEKVHVVGMGCGMERGVAPRDWSTPRFLFVGVDFERKNGPAVLRAFAQVRAQHPRARLDVVGGHPRLPEHNGVTSHGLLRRDVPAERARVRGLFSHATCFVMPSLYEPSALVYTEAGACGVPSIGTSSGGSADLIGDGGVAIDPRDEDALVAHMLAFCDPDHAQAVGARAFARSGLFTWAAVAERLLQAGDGTIGDDPIQLRVAAGTSA